MGAQKHFNFILCWSTVWIDFLEKHFIHHWHVKWTYLLFTTLLFGIPRIFSLSIFVNLASDYGLCIILFAHIIDCNFAQYIAAHVAYSTGTFSDTLRI